VEWAPDAARLVQFGGRAQVSRASRLDRTFTSSGPILLIDRRDQSTSAAAWMHARLALSPALAVSTGTRLDRWQITHETAVSPWLLAEWLAGSRTRVRGGAGLQRQAPIAEQTAFEDPQAPLRSERALTVDAGLDHRFGDTWRATATAYARVEDDRLRLYGVEPYARGGIVVRPDAPLWRNTLSGIARGAGLALERRSTNGLSGWIAYAFDDSSLEDHATGERFASDFDQRHTLTAYAIYRWSGRTSLSARWRSGSNFPVPGYYARIGEEYFLADERNRVRLPAYSRADVRADRTFTFRRRRLTLFVEVLNLLNRRNVGLAEPRVDSRTGRVRSVVEDLFPLLPSAGILVEF
jgi:hypothetical protein